MPTTVVELARDSMVLAVGFGTSEAPSKEHIASLAVLYRRAAEANLNDFENTVVNEITSGAGVHPDRVKLVLLSNDDNYLFALWSLRAMSTLKDRAGGNINGSCAVLGGALNAYIWSSLLVVKDYLLDGIIDENPQITGVTNDRAMTTRIDFAENRATEYIGLAQAASGDEIHPVLNHDNTQAARDKGTTRNQADRGAKSEIVVSRDRPRVGSKVLKVDRCTWLNQGPSGKAAVHRLCGRGDVVHPRCSAMVAQRGVACE